jgi:hypothetical protein
MWKCCQPGRDAAALIQVSPPDGRGKVSLGIPGFTAEVLRGNKRMQAIFNHSEYKVTVKLSDDVCSFQIDF